MQGNRGLLNLKVSVSFSNTACTKITDSALSMWLGIIWIKTSWSIRNQISFESKNTSDNINNIITVKLINCHQVLKLLILHCKAHFFYFFSSKPILEQIFGIKKECAYVWCCSFATYNPPPPLVGQSEGKGYSTPFDHSNQVTCKRADKKTIIFLPLKRVFSTYAVL